MAAPPRPPPPGGPSGSSGPRRTLGAPPENSAPRERWLFEQGQLDLTPSRRCGVDAAKEASYRQQAANLIQEIGQKLSVTQLCINTAIVYMHRFYMHHSFTKFHRNSTAASSLFLAAKVEEQPRKLEHVIRTAHACLYRDQPPLDVKSEAYLDLADELVIDENILLQTLGFNITVDHPHTHIVKTCTMVRASKDLAQTSYFLATNSLHLTTMCLQYTPTTVACVCIHLACKWSSFEIPQSSEGKPWFQYVDAKMSKEQLEALTRDFLEVLEKSPSKIKKKLMSHRAATAAADGGASTSSLSLPDLKGRIKPEPSAALGAPPASTTSALTGSQGRGDPSRGAGTWGAPSMPAPSAPTALTNHDRSSTSRGPPATGPPMKSESHAEGGGAELHRSGPLQQGGRPVRVHPLGSGGSSTGGQAQGQGGQGRPGSTSGQSGLPAGEHRSTMDGKSGVRVDDRVISTIVSSHQSGSHVSAGGGNMAAVSRDLAGQQAGSSSLRRSKTDSMLTTLSTRDHTRLMTQAPPPRENTAASVTHAPHATAHITSKEYMERRERERVEKERVEKERVDKALVEKERLEKERVEKERLEKERLEKERLEKERLEKERLDKEQLEKERVEKERNLEKERLEKDRLDKERGDKERLERERFERERLLAVRVKSVASSSPHPLSSLLPGAPSNASTPSTSKPTSQNILDKAKPLRKEKSFSDRFNVAQIKPESHKTSTDSTGKTEPTFVAESSEPTQHSPTKNSRLSLPHARKPSPAEPSKARMKLDIGGVGYASPAQPASAQELVTVDLAPVQRSRRREEGLSQGLTIDDTVKPTGAAGDDRKRSSNGSSLHAEVEGSHQAVRLHGTDSASSTSQADGTTPMLAHRPRKHESSHHHRAQDSPNLTPAPPAPIQPIKLKIKDLVPPPAAVAPSVPVAHQSRSRLSDSFSHSASSPTPQRPPRAPEDGVPESGGLRLKVTLRGSSSVASLSDEASCSRVCPGVPPPEGGSSSVAATTPGVKLVLSKDRLSGAYSSGRSSSTHHRHHRTHEHRSSSKHLRGEHPPVAEHLLPPPMGGSGSEDAPLRSSSPHRGVDVGGESPREEGELADDEDFPPAEESVVVSEGRSGRKRRGSECIDGGREGKRRPMALGNGHEQGGLGRDNHEGGSRRRHDGGERRRSSHHGGAAGAPNSKGGSEHPSKHRSSVSVTLSRAHNSYERLQAPPLPTSEPSSPPSPL